MKLPTSALSNVQLLRYAARLAIPNFRGVYCKDSLPTLGKPLKRECAIVNLDDCKTGSGTHWVCYVSNFPQCHYFDPIGNLKPPVELSEYFRGYRILYNYDRVQPVKSSLCGQLCLQFLSEATLPSPHLKS